MKNFGVKQIGFHQTGTVREGLQPQQYSVPYFKKGKGIHIKKKNRGKFTEYCGGEATDECIQKAKNSKNPKIRKRATFAANARGWAKKHQEGGEFNPPKITLEQLNLVKDDPKLLESLVRQNMRDYARAWYSERSKQSKYEPQLSGNMDQINTLLDQDRYFPMKEVTTMLGNKYPVGEGGFEVAGGFVTRDKSIDDKPFWFGNGLGTWWHEGIGHWIGNQVPRLLSKRPNSYMRYLHPEYDPVGTYEKHINKNDEMQADIWEFRGLNRNLRDANGKLYIDPNRQLTPKDVEEMQKNPKFRLPGQWKNTNINSESIANMHNTFADASINKNNESLFAKRGNKLRYLYGL